MTILSITSLTFAASQFSFFRDTLNLVEVDQSLVQAYKKVEIDKAWKVSDILFTDLKKIKVGIIDSGFDNKHPEFNGIDKGKTPSIAKFDHDTSGGHGTEVTGIIAANNLSKNSPSDYELPQMNGIFNGIKPGDIVLEHRFDGGVDLDDVLLAINDLADNNVDFVNMSLSFSSTNSLLCDTVIAGATEALRLKMSDFPNILFPVAAGEPVPKGIDCITPANLGNDLPNVVTVGGTLLNDMRSSNSSFGEEVSLTAPSVDVYAPRPPFDFEDEGKYSSGDLFFGTSASTPLVSGVSGILQSSLPSIKNNLPNFNMDPGTVKRTLIKSADPISTDEALGYGCFKFDPNQHNGCRLNAHRAVAWWLPPAPVENLDAQVISSPSVSTLSTLFTPEPPEPKGIQTKTARTFEFNNSNLPDLTLESLEWITLSFTSNKDKIFFNISNNQTSTSTKLTLKGLPPNEDFVLYEDSFQNPTDLITDSSGKLSYTQDISQPHSIWLQPNPGTTIISQDTTLTSDLNDSVEIDSDNVTLDCNGYTISGSGSFGVNVFGKNNVTIRNCTIEGFSTAIQYFNGSNFTLENSTIEQNSNGVFVFFADGNEFRNNVFSNNGGQGLFWNGSGNNLMRNNNFSNNPINFEIEVGDTGNDIDSSNMINGKSMKYLSGVNGININDATSFGYLGIENSSNITIENTTLPEDNGEGLLLLSTSNIKVDNVSVSSNREGIDITSGNSNTIKNSAISSNEIGIDVLGGNNHFITQNDLSANSEGISMNGLQDTVSKNTITQNGTGIFSLFGREHHIFGNLISNNQRGLQFFFDEDNVFEENDIEDNITGIELILSENDLIFNNNFINNGTQASVSGGSANEFDNGSQDGGNHWSDFNETGEGCSDTSPQDGICDFPKTITSNISDNFPFTQKDGWVGPQHEDIEIKWDVLSNFNTTTPDFVSFKILRDTQSIESFDSNLVIETITDPSTESFIDENREVGTTFHYKIFTEDGAGLRSSSNEVTVTP